MHPELSNSYTPQPQLATGHLQPAANLYNSYGSGPITSDRKRPAEDGSLPPTKKIRHRRDGNRRESNKPSRWYQPLTCKPTDWSPPPREPSGRPGSPPPKVYKQPLFRYNDQGEWPGNVRYSRQELEAFLVGPGGDGRAPSRKGKLTMWIQYTPACELHRYGPEASICRWDECPVKKNTIWKGQFRVAFDEHAETSGMVTDPFHCAGYMHLYCFEEAFNLYGFFFDDRFNIRPDRRIFQHEERNPMALSGALVGVLDSWIQSEGKALRESRQNRRPGEVDRVTPNERRLWHVLTKAQTSSPGYLEQLDRRNDIHLGKYMGDLRLYQQMKDEKLQMERETRAIVIEDDEDDERMSGRSIMSNHAEPVSDSRTMMPVTTQCAVQQPAQPAAGHSQVNISQPRRPILPRYSIPATRKRSKSADKVEQAAYQALLSQKRSRTPDEQPVTSSQAPRPSIAMYKPPVSQKRSRLAVEDEKSGVQAAKRSRIDTRTTEAEIEAGVRKELPKRNRREVCRVSRILTSMVPAISGMPHYKRLEVESLVSREADRVRMGVARQWGSLPTGLGCRA
jgi:hypothetical protein